MTMEKAPAVKSPAATRPSLFLQRKCACRGSHESASQCEACKLNAMKLERRSTGATTAPSAKSASGHDFSRMRVHPANSELSRNEAPASVYHVLRSPGQSLEAAVRRRVERQFGFRFPE